MSQSRWMHKTQNRVLVIAENSGQREQNALRQDVAHLGSSVEVFDLASGHGELRLGKKIAGLITLGHVLRRIHHSGAVVLHRSVPRTNAIAAFARACAQILKRPLLSWDLCVRPTAAEVPRPVPVQEVSRLRVRRFAYVGSVTSACGVAEILDASHELRNLPFRVDVYGPLVDGFTREAFRESHRVHYRGSLEEGDRSRVLKEADVLLLPPRNPEESYSRAVLDAYSAGKPIIATRRGSLPRLVEDGVSGILVPPGDSFGLADAMRQLIESPETLSTLQEGASGSAGRIAALLQAEELALSLAAERERQAAAGLGQGWRRLSLRRRVAPATSPDPPPVAAGSAGR